VNLSAVKVVSQQRHSLPDRNRHVARQQAVKITWNVPGVQSVVNALEVQN
jgi:hypothetical protein